jgi:hypothetical protein
MQLQNSPTIFKGLILSITVHPGSVVQGSWRSATPTALPALSLYEQVPWRGILCQPRNHYGLLVLSYGMSSNWELPNTRPVCSHFPPKWIPRDYGMPWTFGAGPTKTYPLFCRPIWTEFNTRTRPVRWDQPYCFSADPSFASASDWRILSLPRNHRESAWRHQ